MIHAAHDFSPFSCISTPEYQIGSIAIQLPNLFDLVSQIDEDLDTLLIVSR